MSRIIPSRMSYSIHACTRFNSYLFKDIQLSCEQKAAFRIRERKHRSHYSPVELETEVLPDEIKETNVFQSAALKSMKAANKKTKIHSYNHL